MINELTSIDVIIKAIFRICPKAQFTVVGNSLDVNEQGFLKCVKWNDSSYGEPKANDILTQIEIINKEWIDTQYQRQRAPEYPSIGDQLDALFHAGVFPPEMAAQIQAVKDKYPKES